MIQSLMSQKIKNNQNEIFFAKSYTIHNRAGQIIEVKSTEIVFLYSFGSIIY